MGISAPISRITEYYARHGFTATIRRARVALTRALFTSRMVIFYLDLARQGLRPVAVPSPFRVDRLKSEVELTEQVLLAMIDLWNPRLARQNVHERFAKGAQLWVIKSGNSLAGYGWTLQGRTIEPYYFPLGPNDVHLFDFHVFSQYRGRGLNPILVGYILYHLAADCGGRAFIEAAEWNEAQLSSLRKTTFQRLGLAKSFTILGRKFTSWTDNMGHAPQTEEKRDKAPAMATSHER